MHDDPASPYALLLPVTSFLIRLRHLLFASSQPKIKLYHSSYLALPSRSYFLADRTSLFLKTQKQFGPIESIVLSVAALGAGIATMKPAEKDLGFLNKDQMEEWKRVVANRNSYLPLLHCPSKPYVSPFPIRNMPVTHRSQLQSQTSTPIHVVVTAYVFMNGYSEFREPFHYSMLSALVMPSNKNILMRKGYYYNTADYGFVRVAAVLVRLNLLPVVLAVRPMLSMCMSAVRANARA